MRSIRFIVAVLSVVLVVYMVSGCNTVRGIGKDVEKGGKAIQDVTVK